MKKSVDYSFVLGYVSGLSAKLLTKQKLEKIKNSKTVDEFFNFLKKEKFTIKNGTKYKEFKNMLEKDFCETIKELKSFCNDAEEFEYVFCKSNFLNFKICLNEKFSNKETKSSNVFLSDINQEEIKECIKNKDFSSIKKPFDMAFKNCFNIFLELQNKKQIDVKIDQEMYRTLLKLAKNNEFLTKRTKLEISLKNINFLIRSLNLNRDITEKELNLCLIENGVLDIKNQINLKTKNIKEILKLYEKLNIYGLDLSQNEIIEKIETIEEKILKEFDTSYVFENFNFTPIFNFIISLKKEIEILKETMLKLN